MKSLVCCHCGRLQRPDEVGDKGDWIYIAASGGKVCCGTCGLKHYGVKPKSKATP